ncbi:permease [Clostridium tarantellae]|uniref:Permease n=1 Tax=Clostridium tarantellae TaxID=39493 RepID=A0A6I1MGS7_9CLOT|nr:permease [Clostridium tarantellae]MPQ42575.1 permease [Clostridium tarantellae]
MGGVINKFIVIFSSIMLEALPFILIGAMLSALMEVFFSEKIIHKIIPKSRILGSIQASLMGIIFPICECATVPITKGLIQKKVPLNVAITYMLAAPIVNPLVIISTYYAFNGNIKIVLLRVGLGVTIAILSGLIMLMLNNENDILKNGYFNSKELCLCGCEDINITDGKVKQLLRHVSIEFYEIGKYFIIGSALASIFQIVISQETLMTVGKGSVLGIVVLMLFSFLISLCSEADAFVATTFMNKFSLGAITGFLIIGPMVDIKNTVMLFSAFKKSFVIKLIFVVSALCFISSCLIF